MASSSRPEVHLLLRPEPAEAKNKPVTSLHYTITIKGLTFEEGDYLYTFADNFGLPPHLCWEWLDDIARGLQDGGGSVPYHITGSGPRSSTAEEQLVKAMRQTSGDITLSATMATDEAFPSYSNQCKFDRCGDPEGGFISGGWRFLPRINIPACQLVFEWDLSSFPKGTRAVLSYGEGAGPICTTGDTDTLLECVFMVGPVQSFPSEPLSPSQETGRGVGATYWFGQLPQTLDNVKDYVAKMLPPLAVHFGDKSASYRAFLRRGPVDFRGTALRASGIIDFDKDTGKEHDWDVVRTINRAMISSWARLDPEEDGSRNEWFTDGLSYLYTVFLPFRFGQRGPDYFRATLNAFLSGYYTNPDITTPLAEVTERAAVYADWYAEWAKALRACVYMLQMDARTRRAAMDRGVDVARPLDELVRELCNRRRSGAKVGKKEWLAGIAHWLGQEEAERLFHEMLEKGTVIELDNMPESFGQTYTPQIIEQEVLDFGFKEMDLECGIVRNGVDGGSRAEAAGLQDFDLIQWYTRIELCHFYFEKKFEMLVDRGDDQPFLMSYWPRAERKVKCWQVLERRKSSGEQNSE